MYFLSCEEIKTIIIIIMNAALLYLAFKKKIVFHLETP